MVAQVLFTELAHQSGSDVGEDTLKCEDTWSEGDGKRYGMRMCSGSEVWFSSPFPTRVSPNRG